MWRFDWRAHLPGSRHFLGRGDGEGTSGGGAKAASWHQRLYMHVVSLRDALFRGGKSEEAADGPNLNAAQLHQRALQNMRRIAAAGAVLIALDLLASLTGASVPIVEEDGRLYLIRPAPGEAPGHISLDASVRSGSETIEDRFEIRLEPGQSSEEQEAGQDSSASRREVSPQELIRSEFRAIAAGFNDDLASRRVLLPQRLDSGEKISWHRSRTSNTLLLVMLTGILMLAVYRSRMQPLRKQEAARRRSVIVQLPEFLNELVLLLNAGLVLSHAFQVAVKQMPPAGDDYFRKNLRRIRHSLAHTNGVMHEELQTFARDSGVSELMRVSGVISDNINKGAELNRKLQRESESLWLARKLRAEEQGRLAETKMTLPLSIFLCVLIVITVAPALLQL